MAQNISPLLLHSIKCMLRTLPSQPSSAAYIHRVPGEFRNGNEDHYTPKMVSIGPFHAANQKLDAAVGQQLKCRALHYLLDRPQNGTTLESLLLFLQGIEGEVRLCYAEPINLSFDNFVLMMLLDGCFILALLTGNYPIPVGRERELFLYSIQQDLLILENQLPFFVLEDLFGNAGLGLREPVNVNFRKYVFEFFKPIMPNRYLFPLDDLAFSSIKPPRHLLELVLLSVFPPPNPNATPVGFRPNLFRKMNISELALYGIKFFSLYDGNSVANISFSDKGLLKIPRLSIYESTTSLFKNLLALEKCSGDQTQSCFESYICLLDTLVDTVEDVERLISAGVLKTTINDKKALVSLLSDLAINNVPSDSRLTYFRHVYFHIEFYCDSRLARLRANFQRYYFESRWDILNSILLFILTVTSTLFAILSYKPPN